MSETLCNQNLDVLYDESVETMVKGLEQFFLFKYVLLGIVILSMVTVVLDFVKNLRYMHKVEKKVEAIILIFLRLEEE